MADKKITALTDIGTSIASADVWMVIDDVAGTPTNKKMSVSNFTPYLPYYLGFSQAADALSASTGTVVMDPLTAVSTITSTGAYASTLAVGTTNQVKFISAISISGTVTLTPIVFTGGTTIAFNSTGDSCTLMYLNVTNGWVCISNNGCTIA